MWYSKAIWCHKQHYNNHTALPEVISKCWRNPGNPLRTKYDLRSDNDVELLTSSNRDSVPTRHILSIQIFKNFSGHKVQLPLAKKVVFLKKKHKKHKNPQHWLHSSQWYRASVQKFGKCSTLSLSHQKSSLFSRKNIKNWKKSRFFHKKSPRVRRSRNKQIKNIQFSAKHKFSRLGRHFKSVFETFYIKILLKHNKQKSINFSSYTLRWSKVSKDVPCGRGKEESSCRRKRQGRTTAVALPSNTNLRDSEIFATCTATAEVAMAPLPPPKNRRSRHGFNRLDDKTFRKQRSI